MKTDNIHKIDCTTVTIYRNTKTGETSKEKVEGPDIVTDVTVHDLTERIGCFPESYE
tara:strand:- start:205 stop:375 length:171 start_codon:yes stop_codon:yes gene_type:complete